MSVTDRLSTFFLLPSILISIATGTVNAEKGHIQVDRGSIVIADQVGAFDVISIRPSDPKKLGFAIMPDVDNFKITGANLKFLIRYAYDLHDFQIESAPDWVNAARFDISAKMDLPYSQAAHSSLAPPEWEARQRLLQRRLQALLADRFRLRVHKEVKDRPVYSLIVAKDGPKFHESTNDTGFTSRRGEFRCSNTSMDALAATLSDSLNRVVLDQTKLASGYAFTLKWNPTDNPTPENAAPGLITALQEQLGLKLVSTKGPVEVLFVDHIETPAEN